MLQITTFKDLLLDCEIFMNFVIFLDFSGAKKYNKRIKVKGGKNNVTCNHEGNV